jgi:hypothetical protein
VQGWCSSGSLGSEFGNASDTSFFFCIFFLKGGLTLNFPVPGLKSGISA